MPIAIQINLQLTAMLSHPHHTALQLSPAADTPVKDRKLNEPLTAQSEQEGSPGFEDISAEELFRQFSQLVRVTEEEGELHEEGEDVERRLTYDGFPSYKLEFQPKSSMRKPVQKKEVPALKATALFRPEQVGMKVPLVDQNDNECFTPVDRVRKEHPELLRTPHKEPFSGEE